MRRFLFDPTLTEAGGRPSSAAPGKGKGGKRPRLMQAEFGRRDAPNLIR